MAENEQIDNIDRQDKLRKEFDAKLDTQIGKLDTKIENRVTTQTFFGILTILAVIVLSVLAYAVSQVNAIGGKMDDLSKRLTVIETKLDERQALKR